MHSLRGAIQLGAGGRCVLLVAKAWKRVDIAGRNDGRLGLRLVKRGDVETALRRLAPRIPAHEFGAVADHAMNSPGLRPASPETASWLSLVAYARHVLTDYDELLQQGYDQDSARFFVAENLQAILDDWGVRRRLVEGD